MARKGNRKVKTGCLTCKIRKVKCDEGKPHCERCLQTGRKCDGYMTSVRPGLLSYTPTQGFQGVESVDEGRALQFFCEIAGPYLSGAADPYFWTSLVMQFSNFEPVVRKSVVAISTLYEQVQANPQPTAQVRDSRLALGQYNAAIRGLKSMKNEPVVLLVCVLFICIEFLQSNRDTAIKHCKHGIAILEEIGPDIPWVKEYMVPVFRRLSIFPFFFGDDPADFPSLSALETTWPATFSSFTDAHSVMDSIFSRTMELVRKGDPYRLRSPGYGVVPQELIKSREEIKSLLDRWQQLFDEFEATLPIALPITEVVKHFQLGELYMREMTRTFLSLRYEVCRIWSDMAFASDETAYDVYIDTFRALISRCANLRLTPPGEPPIITSRSPKFMFETGFTPTLWFVAMKCRCLETRLEALQLMSVLGVPRENFWEVRMMQALGRRVVEIEHEIVLNDIYSCVDAASSPPNLPPDENRVRETWTESTLSVDATIRGHELSGRLVGFFVQGPDKTIYLHTEFMDEHKGPPHHRIRSTSGHIAAPSARTRLAPTNC
ncbi:hypothetical protein BGZ63DRAFT_347096 [Mariannaea sp. PMI_226]|nr:hypothetical protein BGZ63DRAFT_347096 [Mariannaea sp. PMI_226]